MKVSPALLALLSGAILVMAAPVEETPAPPLPPTLYAQPAGKIKVRFEGKSFLLAEEFKPAVTRLLGEANYAKTREFYLSVRRSLTEKILLEAKIRQVESLAKGANDRLENLRAKHVELKAKLLAMRLDPEAFPDADLDSYVRLGTSIAATAAQIDREEELAASAQGKFEDMRLKVEPALQAARKLSDDYLETLKAYERPITELRELAVAKGTAL
ncbi:hypothetical protein LBMAG55_13850 [Verrucomicrobiota bacterium]|nr:hypothetical protein LBMAG55_13850 [Verrucomicrobiota bacterium]